MSAQASPALGGLAVGDWLREHGRTEPEPAVLGPQAAIAPAETRAASARPRWSSVLGNVAGLTLGGWLAFGVLRPAGCPPPGEGAVYCQLQHGVLRTLMTVLLSWAAVTLATRALARVPDLLRRRAEGRLLPGPPAPMPEGDDLLLRASHGYAYTSSRRVAGVWRPRWVVRQTVFSPIGQLTPVPPSPQ